ncbi:MAG: DUF3710 domain-containing protein [Marmoricola sp.]
MRFGRKAAPGDVGEPDQVSANGPTDTPGPHDDADVDLEGQEFIDLGSLLITPAGEMEMRLSVDEASGEVLAAVLVNEAGALELRAFAASRNEGSWDDLRPQIVAETVRLGGTATEQEGPFGPELLCLVPVQTPEGEPATQASRVMAHQGPRWLLRATVMGQPAVEPALAGPWEETVRNTVVRRGRDAMPPGTPLPLHLPAQARRVDGPAPTDD